MLAYKEGNTVVIYDVNLIAAQKRQKAIRGFGFLLFGVSVVSVLLFILPIISSELHFRLYQLAKPQKQSVTDTTQLSRFGQLMWFANWQFGLLVPSVGINAKVTENIDIANAPGYQATLKESVAHANGTSLPNQPGTTFIFGHSTNYPWNISRYNAVFYPLQYVKEGDTIIVVFAGQNFLYQVEEKRIVDATDISYLQSQNDKKLLILQTCWPPGTTWKRLIIVAQPQNV